MEDGRRSSSVVSCKNRLEVEDSREVRHGIGEIWAADRKPVVANQNLNTLFKPVQKMYIGMRVRCFAF